MNDIYETLFREKEEGLKLQFITSEEGRVIPIGGPSSGGGSAGTGQINPIEGIHETSGGIPFNTRDEASRLDALKKAGWNIDEKASSIEQYTNATMAGADRAVRMRGFSSNVGIEIFDVINGKIDGTTRRTVWYRNSTAIPSKRDVQTWVKTRQIG